jgi:hypothetical protein
MAGFIAVSLPDSYGGTPGRLAPIDAESAAASQDRDRTRLRHLAVN